MSHLDGQTPETLCRWWCLLNGWTWPDDLPLKPEGWEALPDYVRGYRESRVECKAFYIAPICDHIIGVVGEKALLHYHNVVMGRRMTEAQFEAWYPTRITRHPR